MYCLLSIRAESNASRIPLSVLSLSISLVIIGMPSYAMQMLPSNSLIGTTCVSDRFSFRDLFFCNSSLNCSMIFFKFMMFVVFYCRLILHYYFDVILLYINVLII